MNFDIAIRMIGRFRCSRVAVGPVLSGESDGYVSLQALSGSATASEVCIAAIRMIRRLRKVVGAVGAHCKFLYSTVAIWMIGRARNIDVTVRATGGPCVAAIRMIGSFIGLRS
jgi:hypothetical protein